ncbi:MAG: hypothetical protein JWM99_3239, partial [Verrucomicrobiales bacterium]|nr:hypothetical protein [Verrucomicrobiales bacterium]
NTDHRVVIRLEVGTSLTSLWIDPSTEADASVQSDTGNPLAITSFALRQASGIGALRIDDIVLATTFEELAGRQPGSPVVVRSPTGLTVTAGMPASFSVDAAGAEPLLYQWFFNNSEITEATNSTFQISQTTHADAGAYKVKISNAAGFVMSDIATLMVDDPILPPVIIRPPESAVIVSGETATFQVVANGTEPMLYQWYFNGNRLLLETNSTLTIGNAAASASGAYKVTVSNSAGIAFSDIAMLTVEDPELSPMIISEPVSLIVNAGESADFSVGAIGTLPLFYQWFFKDGELMYETNSFLHLPQVAEPNNGEYQVRITNHTGTAISRAVTLTVKIPAAPPNISRQPESIEVATGETTTFSVAVGGTEPILFQWYKDTLPVAGETNAILALVNVTTIDSGRYYVAVSNQAGDILSDSAFLHVNPPPIPKPPLIIFTNYLSHLVRPGDLETNTFREQVLQPGESFRMEVEISDQNDQPLSLRLNTNELPTEARWATLARSPTSLTGTFEFTPAQASAGQYYTLQIEAADTRSTNQFECLLYVPTIEEQNIVITEFLTNPDISMDSPYFNPLHRPIAESIMESDDQYLEIANLSAETVEFKGWTISDGAKVWHKFDQTFRLQSSNAVIIYGGSRTGSEPMLETPSFAASAGASGLELDDNGGILLLRNPDGQLISRVVYGSLSSRSSMTRFPDANGAFTPQESVSVHLFSPGMKWNGEPFMNRAQPIAAENVKIEQISGNQLRITWNARAGQSYSVLRARVVTDPFEPVGSSLQFINETGEYIDLLDVSGTNFYLVRSP